MHKNREVFTKIIYSLFFFFFLARAAGALAGVAVGASYTLFAAFLCFDYIGESSADYKRDNGYYNNIFDHSPI